MMGFRGFERADGQAGTRNHMLLLSVTGLTTPICRHVATRLKFAISIGTGNGAGQLGRDASNQERCMQSFACHPNVGAVVVIGADQMKIAPVVEAAQAAGRIVEGLCLDDFGHDGLKLSDAALRVGADFLKRLSAQQRVQIKASALSLALECGRSDPSSGLVANPLVGRIADQLVEAGGTAMIGETTEWLGAEQILLNRAGSPDIAKAIEKAAASREHMAINAGINLTYNNPSLTNIQAGLSSIEEKSLGAVAKSGSSEIQGVLDYGQRPSSAGLWVMDAPAYATESLTGFAAAGCNLALFTTGVGNSYTSATMPTIKLTANPETAKRLQNQLDFSAHNVFEGRSSLIEVQDELWGLMCSIASGELTWGEVLGDHDEVISRFGATL